MGIDVPRQRQLHQYPVDRVIGVELLDLGHEYCFRDVGGEATLKGAEPGGTAGATLGPHIDLAGRVVAHEDGGKAGSQVHLVTQSSRNTGGTAAQPGGKRLAVDYFGLNHPALPRSPADTKISRFRIRAMVPYQLTSICALGGAWHDDDGDCDLPMPCLPAQLRGRPAIVALQLREPSQFGDRTGVETRRDRGRRGFAVALRRSAVAAQSAAHLARRGLDPACPA